jgi:hypothetical protein
MAGTKSRLARWQGRLRLNGVVGVLQTHAPSFDSICRTAVYVTRTHGGVGGGSREASPYPDRAPRDRVRHAGKDSDPARIHRRRRNRRSRERRPVGLARLVRGRTAEPEHAADLGRRHPQRPLWHLSRWIRDAGCYVKDEPEDQDRPLCDADSFSPPGAPPNSSSSGGRITYANT